MTVKTLSGYRKNAQGIWVQRSSHGQHNVFDEHAHDFIELVYVVQGEGLHLIDRFPYEVRAGDMYSIHPGERHAIEHLNGSGIEIINVLFVPQSLAGCLPGDQEMPGTLAFITPFMDGSSRLPRKMTLSAEQSSAIVGILEDMIAETKDEDSGSPLLIRFKLMELLVLLSRFYEKRETIKQVSYACGGHEILTRRVRVFLEDHFHQKLTLAYLAQVFNLSERHLGRVFKQETGRSVNEMLQHIRIERAKQMLHETNRSMEVVAESVGFANASFFSRLFSRIVGATPGEYRKMAKNRRIS